MPRVIFHRLHDLAPGQLAELHQKAETFAQSRDWRGDRFWVASARSTDLFGMEYFRHARDEEGPSLAAAGFLNFGGDETDVLATLFFLHESSRHFQARASWRDEQNPIAKMRYLEIRRGELPAGMPIEGVLAARPVFKKLGGTAITFYPPTYKPNSYFRRDKPGMWGFSLQGMRDFAPTFLEAEAEAMRIYRGLEGLDR